MSEVRLVVRELERDWSGTMHGSCAEAAVAALSADPVTLDELETAVGRFEKPHRQRRFFACLSQSLCDEPYDAGLVVIDLVAPLIVADNTYFQLERSGHLAYHDGQQLTETPVGYHLADDWLFSREGLDWQALADERREKAAANPPRDVRAIFYGKPLAEFIAREAFAAFARRPQIEAATRVRWADERRQWLARKEGVAPEAIDASRLTDEEIRPKPWPGQEIYASPYYHAIKDIHAAWLVTPRADLGGKCPREVALDERNHISRDESDRCEQWSRMGRCPVGLSRTSHAYIYAGFGTHELVEYYELVRELLWFAWHQLTELDASPNAGHQPGSMTVGDFLTTAVPRLEAHREAWLDAPDRESPGRTPRSIIESERARIPWAVSREEAFHDPDCPCCQMLADLPGPTFCHLDGCNMDKEFAFSIDCKTREEWDAEQREYQEISRRMDAEEAERKRLGVSYDDKTDGSIWTQSFAVEQTADVPLGVRVFGIGCKLAEVLTRLREEPGNLSADDTQRHIDQLNRDFGNLRDILQRADASLTEALFEPVVDRLGESLAAVGQAQPELLRYSDELTSELRKLLDPPFKGPSPRFDEEIPF